MDLQLHPNSIKSVRYKLNYGKEATLYFDANGCLYDVDVDESMKLCNNPACTPKKSEPKKRLDECKPEAIL